MANRARHPVHRQVVQRAPPTGGDTGQVGEDLSLATRSVRDFLHRRCVTRRALVLDFCGAPRMVDCLAADARQHVRVAGRVRHDRSPPAGADRDILSTLCNQVVVARHALARCGEHPNVRRLVRARRWFGRRLVRVGPQCGEQACGQPSRRGDDNRRGEAAHFQNSKKPPSYQSHST
jgi:hypothetical protein